MNTDGTIIQVAVPAPLRTTFDYLPPVNVEVNSLSIGMRVRVNEATPRRISFEADAEEHVLAPVLAANLSVLPLPKEEEMIGPFERLSTLDLGERARVVALSPVLRGAERRRLLDLGLIPGTEVAAELESPGGDPVGYRVRGAVIALRREQAEQVKIERVA